MRLGLALIPLALVAPSCAQYFSAGWTPGQAVPTEASSPPSFAPETSPLPPPRQGESRFSLLSSGGLVSRVFDRLGLNLTESLEAAKASSDIWDDRIPLITDDNYNDLIVNEVLTTEEEKDRVWFLIITGATGQSSGVSLFADKEFNQAYNTSLIENDLPHVRWARIDYMNVSYITSKWAIWNAPVLVAVSDRGKALRFWRATQIRLRAESLREFLKSGIWEHTPPWQTSFAPGGDREFLMEWQAIFLTKSYNTIRLVPRWGLYILTGVLSSFLMNLIHRGGTPAAVKADPVVPAITQSDVTGSSNTAVAPSATRATPTKGKGKKGKK